MKKLLQSARQDVGQWWQTLWLLAYVFFLAQDIFYGTSGPTATLSSVVKYAGMITLFAYTLKKFRQDTLLVLAIAATLLADFFLVLTPIWAGNYFYIWGVICFAVVQMLHICRQELPNVTLSTLKDANSTVGLLMTLSIIIIILICIKPFLGPNLYFIYTGIYAGLLITNFISAIRRYRQKPGDLRVFYALLGFALFLLSDGCIALQSVLRGRALNIVELLVWALYFPAQIALVNSSTLSANKLDSIKS